jgi:hypothetical protein
MRRGRRQKTEDRRQKTEDRRQKTEDRRQKTEEHPPVPSLFFWLLTNVSEPF